MIFQLGINKYQSMIRAKIKKEKQKSTRQTIAEDIGMIIFGKYTLEIKGTLEIMELVLWVIEVVKKFQGNNPAYTRIG